jgi:co-chaperonin GroES (HSP10)
MKFRPLHDRVVVKRIDAAMTMSSVSVITNTLRLRRDCGATRIRR